MAVTDHESRSQVIAGQYSRKLALLDYVLSTIRLHRTAGNFDRLQKLIKCDINSKAALARRFRDKVVRPTSLLNSLR